MVLIHFVHKRIDFPFTTALCKFKYCRRIVPTFEWLRCIPFFGPRPQILQVWDIFIRFYLFISYNSYFSKSL